MPEATMVIDAVLGPECSHHHDGLVGAGAGLAQRHGECVELDRLVPPPYTDIDPSATQYVDQRDLFGNPDRVVQRKRDDGGAEADAFGERSGVRGHRHGVGQEAVVGEVVLAHPARVETETIGGTDQRQLVADSPVVGRADTLTLEQMIGGDALGVGEHEGVKRRELHREGSQSLRGP